MMKKSILIAILMGLVGVGLVQAQQQNCYLVKPDGSRQKAVAIQVANQQGDLMINVDGRGAVNIKRGTYRYAMIPKPQEVQQLEQLFDEEKYQDVVKNAPAVFEAYKFLGWGDVIGGLEAESQLALKKTDDARKVLAKAVPFVAERPDALMRANLLIMLENKEYDKIDAELNKLVLSKEDAYAAFAFNMRGQIYALQGQKKQAVLEYLKTMLLFDGRKLRKERAEAKKQAVAIMKELNDPRVSKIEAID